jgi:hypothetical protein
MTSDEFRESLTATEPPLTALEILLPRPRAVPQFFC